MQSGDRLAIKVNFLNNSNPFPISGTLFNLGKFISPWPLPDGLYTYTLNPHKSIIGVQKANLHSLQHMFITWLKKKLQQILSKLKSVLKS